MGAAAIAQALGGSSHQTGEWNRCPCPVCGSRSDCLAIKDGDHGPIFKCWRGCTHADVRAEVQARGLSLEPSSAPREYDLEAEQQRRQEDEDRRIRRAIEMWQSSQPAENIVFDTYLRSRAIVLPAFPLSLRFIPAGHYFAWHSGSRSNAYPVMLGAVVDRDCQVIGMHRTWLQPDGSGKARIDPNRMTLGRMAGGAVRLGMIDPSPDQTLIVAEGIESALSASLLMGNPAWAALSAGGIEQLPLPDEIRMIQIAVDRDANNCGEAAARAAALRWLSEGRRVQLVIPDRLGADANDLLREASK